MDYVTRQFISLTKKLRKDFRKALTSLGIDLHDIKNSIQSIDEHAQAYQQKEQSKPEVIAVMHEPEGTQAERHSADTGIKRRDRIRLLVEWLTFFAVALYGFVAFRQLKEMIVATGAAQQAVVEARLNRIQADKALKTTIEQFHLEQRAWLGINGTNVEELSPSKFTAWLTLYNSGKTPARQEALAIGLIFAPLPILDGPDEKDIANLHPSGSTVVAPQGTKSLQGWPADPKSSAKAQKMFVTDYPFIDSGTGIIYVYGEVTYVDIYDRPHVTKFCNYTVKLTSNKWGLVNCKKFNEMD